MSETEKSKSNKESSNTATNAPTTTVANKASGSSSSTSSSTIPTSAATSGSNSSTKHTSKVTSATPKLLPPPAPVSRPRVNAVSEQVIKKAFADFMKDPECLDKAADYLYESLLEDAVVGVYLEVHHAVKSGALEALEGQTEDDTAFKIVDTPNYDVFGMSTARKAMDCNCPNCDRLVAASKFAPHLEKCMGMGRKTSRHASRRLANAKEGNFNYFSSNVSDDEDDADCSSEKRRKKIQTSRTNGSKKNGKSS